MYARFTFCGCCGSIFGVLAYVARMIQLSNSLIFTHMENSTPNPTAADLQRITAFREEARRWTAAFYALFPLELAFVVAAKLMVRAIMQRTSMSAAHGTRACCVNMWQVLHRVSVFSSASSHKLKVHVLLACVVARLFCSAHVALLTPFLPPLPPSSGLPPAACFRLLSPCASSSASAATWLQQPTSTKPQTSALPSSAPGLLTTLWQAAPSSCSPTSATSSQTTLHPSSASLRFGGLARMPALVTRVQVTMLLIVITAFIAVGVASSRIIAGALQRVISVRNSILTAQVQAA
jgi:hypothetical protein